ncbi:metal ABC transporter substrate-binding protein [Calidifontibacter terrae]
MFTKAAVATLIAAGVTTSLSACGSGDAAASDGKVKVVASFYPIEYAVQQIGGSHVDASSLTPAGAEPHDLELTPREVGSLTKADLLVYTKGFQSAVDQASANAPKTLDLAGAAHLDLNLGSITTIGGADTEGSGTDPHFWLDPTRMKSVGDAVAAQLIKIDPAHKADYTANRATFDTSMTTLDHQFATGLKTCTNRTIVTGHSAFGYLASRYNLRQVGVTGVTPDQEPTPARLRDVAAFVQKNQTTTIYTETLVSPVIAQTVAKNTGAHTAVLDPIEGVTKASAGTNYLEIMHSNLATLRSGQGCS